MQAAYSGMDAEIDDYPMQSNEWVLAANLFALLDALGFQPKIRGKVLEVILELSVKI
jgi:hypothetical protein